MQIEIVNTGTELLVGRVLNTHQQWLCRQLADRGWTVARQVAVPDTGPDIVAAVRSALSRADLVIVTGGLGPTSDDLTRELVAELLGRTLHEDAEVLAVIQQFFASRRRPMPERTRVQALVPSGALVLANRHGTAPGLAIEVQPNPFRENGATSRLVMLPGPPRELYPMFLHQVLPWMNEQCPPPEAYLAVTLHTTGIGESVLEERIDAPLRALLRRGLELGYCARLGQVDVRLAARGAEREAVVAEAEQIVRRLVPQYIYGVGDDLLETVVVRMLTEQHRTVAVAESCTGGFLAHRLTNVPGASAVLLGGAVTYADQVKSELLGVPAELIKTHGAVSEPVARAMAEGARQRFHADFALAVTGIAGPGGGTAAKPVGTVFIALAGPAGTWVINPCNAYDRETFKSVTSQQALELLRQELLSVPAA